LWAGIIAAAQFLDATKHVFRFARQLIIIPSPALGGPGASDAGSSGTSQQPDR
jgi:hypothetical protein